MKDLKLNLANAIKDSYSWCLEPKEYQAVTSTVTYMIDVLALSKEDIIEILEMAQGTDSVADSELDAIIESYKQEVSEG